MIAIRPARPQDSAEIWLILEPVIRAGETYALPRAMSRDTALRYWLAPEHHVFVAEVDGKLLGTYFLQANQKGGGVHVARRGARHWVSETLSATSSMAPMTNTEPRSSGTAKSFESVRPSRLSRIDFKTPPSVGTRGRQFGSMQRGLL